MTKTRSVAATANDNSIPGSRIEDDTLTQDKLDGSISASRIEFSAGASAEIRSVENKLKDRVSVLDYIPESEHAAIKVGTSTYDCTGDIQAAIGNAKTVTVPPGRYRVTGTITVGTRGRALVGETPIITTRPDMVAAELFYDGPENDLLPLIKLGANNVGAQPNVDATACVVQNLVLNCNNKAGFGIYGTYVTNESLVDRVTIYSAREYGMYIAKSWYATYTNIFVRGCRGNGIALGMPLVLLNGVDYSASWTGPSFELNGVRVENLRTGTTGTYFSGENPGTWNPSDASKRMKGYGLGVGVGNGLVVSNVTLEKAGGTLLYMYNTSNPVKVIDGGYLEGAAVNAGLDPTVNQPGVIIDNVGSSGTGIEIRDLFFNFNTGGIYHTGSLSTRVWLKNIHQPRFLKSLDGVGSNTLWATVLKENVRYECGTYNTLESLMSGSGYGTVNTRYSFTVDLLPSGGSKAIYLKGDGTVPIGSYTVTYDNGSTSTHAFPADLGTNFVLDRVVAGSAISITKAGPTDTYNSNVTLKVMDTPSTIR